MLLESEVRDAMEYLTQFAEKIENVEIAIDAKQVVVENANIPISNYFSVDPIELEFGKSTISQNCDSQN